MRHGLPTSAALAVLATTLALGTPRAGADVVLDDAPISRSEFANGFDISNPVTSFSDVHFTLIDSGTAYPEGEVRSQVFAGTGANAGLYAYLYQVVAPPNIAGGDVSLGHGVSELSVPFTGGSQTAIFSPVSDLGAQSIPILSATSIYISSGVDAGSPIGGFTTLGTVPPSSATFDGQNVNFFFTAAASAGLSTQQADGLAAGQTSYIMGAFSTLAPTMGTTTIYGSGSGTAAAFIPAASVPEPTTLLMGGTAIVMGLGYHRLRRKRTRLA